MVIILWTVIAAVSTPSRAHAAATHGVSATRARNPTHPTARARHTHRQYPDVTLQHAALREYDPARAHLLEPIADAAAAVSRRLATATCDSFECFSSLGAGDDELAVDVAAETLLLGAFRDSGSVAVAASPLTPGMAVELPCDDPRYSVAMNPLDGSSVLDTNFAVATLFAVFVGTSLTNVTGRDIVLAGCATYGPRTTLSLAHVDGPGVTEFLLAEDAGGTDGGSRWVRSNEYHRIGEGKLFAPGNLRAVKDHSGYAELVKWYSENEYQLRYTGGMALDVMQLCVKGRGVFMAPASRGGRTPPPARLLFEALPLAYLVERCGGATSDGTRSLLEVCVERLDQRTQVALGAAPDVARFEELVGAADPVRTLAERTV